MRHYTIIIFTLLCHLLVAQTAPQPMLGEIVVTVENIQSLEGDILIGIFDDPEVFLDRGKFMVGKIFPVKNKGEMSFRFPDIPYGTYAIAIYQDKNSDTYFNKNIFGVPKEPYTFYKEVRAKWAVPTFSEASFELNTPTYEIVVELKEWSDR